MNFNFIEMKDKKSIKKQLLSTGLNEDDITFTDRIFFKAEKNNNIIGFIGIDITENIPILEYFFINPEYRGKHFYKKFIHFYYKFLKSFQFKETIIDVKKGPEFKYLNKFVKKVLNREPVRETDRSYFYHVRMDKL